MVRNTLPVAEKKPRQLEDGLLPGGPGAAQEGQVLPDLEGDSLRLLLPGKAASYLAIAY